MNLASEDSTRTVGLLGATGVGIGAIVGGGILVLAGAAFAQTGAGAMLAFALNGAIAGLTAMSFAEMSSSFPESGGAYTFAKKVLTVRAAFAVGWVLWFAYIVAGVLYALGFAEYSAALLRKMWLLAAGEPVPAWLEGRRLVVLLGLAATVAYTLSLIRQNTGGGQWATVGKVVLFCVLILAGLWALLGQPTGTISAGMTPFLPRGTTGLLQAMGFSFIALQGFDLVAAIAGEVRRPERNIPRAMFLSLGAALVIYLPLLFVVCTVGVESGQSITAMSEAHPETVMAIAVQNYLGPFGYWLVMVAAILSTLSALQANLLAASRVALSMARDRTLPRVLGQIHRTRATPVMAIYASALSLVAIVFVVPDLAAAGAAASLIFLIAFALAHGTSILARQRSGGNGASAPAGEPGVVPFRAPMFPLVPVIGGLACVAMAAFQGIAVPAASAITAVWLGLGVILYFALFASRAEAVDAFAEARDADLVRLRGRSPLVLVPVANPATASALAAVANAMAPPQVGRVLLLSVMPRPSGDRSPPQELLVAQDTLRQAVGASLASGLEPEALLTIAGSPWSEIKRVARSHGCESLLLGMARLTDSVIDAGHGLEQLLNEVECDVVILRAAPGWDVAQARRVLVPTGGRGGQDELRARLLGSLCRTASREITFLRVMSPTASASECQEARRALIRSAEDETHMRPVVHLPQTDDMVSAVLERAANSDLVVLGLQRQRRRRLFGQIALKIAEQVPCATILISRRG